MFFTIDDIVSGKKHNVNIMWITSLKNGNDEKSAPNFELLLFQGDGGRPLIESFTTAEERNQRRQAIIEAGSFFIFDDIHYNIVWVQSIAKVNVGDDLYDGTRSQRPGTAVTFANGRVLYGMFDTEAERDEFYDKLMETMLSGGLIQKDTFYDFPKNGNPNCVYLAKDTGITYYWDPELKMYVTTGSGGRKGVYEYNGTLSATTGVRATLNKSDLREIVKATVDFMETSDVIDADGNHAIIVQNDLTTVDVITIADQTINSFKQVLTLTDLPTTGKTNILFYVDDIDEFRIWDEANSEWVEPFHPIVFDGSIAVADARLNTLYVDGTIAKYTNDNVSWTYLSSVLFEDPDLADAIPDTLYINDSVAKYTVDNSKWIYLSSIFFENPDVADAIVKSLYIDGNIAKYTLNNTDWIYLNTEVVRYDQDIKYHEGTLVYINNVLAKAVKDFTSDNSGTDKFASFSKDVYNGNLEVIVDAYTRTNVQYDLTSQLDGVKQVFDIPAVVTNDRSILVFYAGQLLVEGVNYTIDFTNNVLETHFDYAPDSDEDRHLILIAGNIETTPPTLRTVTGEDEGMVDNTDPLNPVVLHDPTKVDSVTGEDEDMVDNTDPLNPVILHDPTKVESVTDEDGDLVDNTDPLNPIILHDPTKLESVTGEDVDMVDDSDPLNPIILHDPAKIDKDVAFDSDGYIEGKTEVSQDGNTVVIDKVNLVVDDNTSESKQYIIKSSDDSIIFDIVEVDDETIEIDVVVDNINSTNIAYDLTDQLDGVTQEFDIDPSIDETKSMILFYAGQYLVRGVNYTVDFTNSTITTLFDEAPDADENRHLTLVVGNTTITDAVQTVAGDMVDNTDPANPIIEHDVEKINVADVPQVLTNVSMNEVTDGFEIVGTITDTSDGSSVDGKVIIKPDDSIKVEVTTVDPLTKEVKISAKSDVTIVENAITFDGVNSEFTLPSNIDTSRPIIVTVNGLIQTPGVDADYEIVGNKMKFACIFDADSNVTIANFK